MGDLISLAQGEHEVVNVYDAVNGFGMTSCAIVIAFNEDENQALCYHWPGFDVKGHSETFVKACEDMGGVGRDVYVLINHAYEEVDEVREALRSLKKLIEKHFSGTEKNVICMMANGIESNIGAKLLPGGQIQILNEHGKYMQVDF